MTENKWTRPTKTVACFRITLSGDHFGASVFVRSIARTAPPSSPNLTLLAMLNQDPDAAGTAGTPKTAKVPLFDNLRREYKIPVPGPHTRPL